MQSKNEPEYLLKRGSCLTFLFLARILVYFLMAETQFQVLLYYKYVTIENPVRAMREQRSLCTTLNLKGRIIVSAEGINGTIEGTTENTERYIEAMEQNEVFKGINYKKSAGTGDAFPKLSVKVRDEIVTSEVPNLNPTDVTGKYLSAEDLHQWFEEKREFYIVDMRNDYEYISGFFEGSILSGFHNFKDLPTVVTKLAHLKDKTIVTVCTGGVRCEKASGFLVTNGFKEVYQLKDGIQTYMELFPNEHFKGKLYVFDNRLTIGFNTDDPKHEIVGTCMHCGAKADTYVNCMNHACHLHFISCDNCLDEETGLAFCKDECKHIAQAKESAAFL